MNFARIEHREDVEMCGKLTCACGSGARSQGFEIVIEFWERCNLYCEPERNHAMIS